MPAATAPLPAADTGPESLRIGEWMVEPALDRLSAGGRSVKLEPKAMAVLVELARTPGQVVSREALLAAGWPGVVVGDDSLTQVVIKLRKALGDTPGQPAYIQTIAKRGYRLIAPVQRGPDAQSQPPSPGVSVTRRWPRTAFLLAAAAALLLVAGAWWSLADRGAGLAALEPAARGEAARAAPPAVAIRAFAVLGDEAQSALLAQGITADLTTDLSKLSGLSVVGEAAGASADSASRARYLVAGSVQRIGERLRLHVHLTDMQAGTQLWSERFDRPLGDFFAIQEEIGLKLLKVLPAKVSEAELRRVARRHTRNLEAYEYFQRGQAALLVRQKGPNETARAMFRRAIALDAAFARAYAGLALTHAADFRNQWTADGAASLERALELARTAHEIDADIAETYWVLAFVHMERRQHEEALRQLEGALRLYPSFADAHALMGGVHTYVGRPAETVRLLRTAMRLNPDAGSLYFLLLGRAYLFLGDLEQARVNLEHALLRNPENLEAHVYMAAMYVLAGDKPQAAWKAEEVRALQPQFTVSGWLATYPMVDAGQKAQLARALGEAGL